MFDWLDSLLGINREPPWERHPEFYYVCPECKGVAVNVEWRIVDIQTDEVVFERDGEKHYVHESYYVCPICDEQVPFEDVRSLKEFPDAI